MDQWQQLPRGVERGIIGSSELLVSNPSRGGAYSQNYRGGGVA